MGHVYRAVREDDYRQRVALKVVRPGLADAELLARFRTERQALAELGHPHIARLLDGGTTADGRPYFVMEYIDGAPLDRFCDCRRLNTAGRVRLLRQVCQAVQHAHEAGILHRDLKQANVLVTADGTPKITDFGLAKRLGGAPGQTETGAVLGTPSYMAPEQAGGRSKEIGPAADVWALGALLYELLTDRPPFRADSPLATLQQVLAQDPVPPRRLRPAVPRDLETVCLKCLQKEPARRYASAAALADDLQRFLDGRPVQARRVGRLGRAWRWCRRRPLVAGLCAALALALLAGPVGLVYVLHATREQDRASARAAAARADALFIFGRNEEALANYEEALRRDPDLSDAYLGRAVALTRKGQYEEAVRDCTEALRRGRWVNPNSADLTGLVRSNARAMLGQWDRAAEDFARALAHRPAEENWEAQLLAMRACCLLAKGDREGYRQACRSLASRQAEHRDAAFRAAISCALSPDSGVEPAVAIRLAEESLQHGPVAWHLLALGLAQYRAGQFEAALKHLREAEAIPWAGHRTTALVQAMAQHRLGHADEARRKLRLATRNPFPYLHPQDAVVYRVLRREAEALLRASDE
jgi:tetratricopeptide (TPR) repeat protein